MAFNYADILYLSRQHVKIDHTQKIIDRFWDMFIMDALLANFDRHGYNWGFLKGEQSYKLAPIYDNGSSLFPTSQIQLNGRKSSYYEIIHSHQFADCDRAANRIFAVLDFKKIDDFRADLWKL